MTKSKSNTQQSHNEPDWENQWMYDDLLQFLTSPLWKVPIYSFLDENCIVFDEEEENKFAYTEIHKKFIQVIEELVEGHLKELGITEEMFTEILTRGLKNAEHRRTFEQLLIIDNFIVFKKLMVKRNKELEYEAMRQIEDEERKNTENSVNEELEINRAGLESEAAEIEHALALSLALMTEHQKLMMEEERMLQEALKASEAEHSKHIEKQIAEKSATEKLAAEKAAKEKLEKEKLEALKKQKEAEATKKDTPLGDEEKAALGLGSSTEDKAKLKVKVEEKKVDENVFDMGAKKAPKQKLEPLGDFGLTSNRESTLPPLNTGSKYDAMGLEELMAQKEKIDNKLSEAKETEKKTVANDEANKESMEERKKRLKAQRDLILAKKKAEREKELQTYQEQNKIEPKPQEDEKIPLEKSTTSSTLSSSTTDKASTEEAEKRANVMKKMKGLI